VRIRALSNAAFQSQWVLQQLLELLANFHTWQTRTGEFHLESPAPLLYIFLGRYVARGILKDPTFIRMEEEDEGGGISG
tara:strand:+ start:882 stop:1118 length:237 start_codon:yes stop_codon:yes gene_type:complete